MGKIKVFGEVMMSFIDATIEILRTKHDSNWSKKFMAGWSPVGIDAEDASVIRELIKEERAQQHVARSRAKRPISRRLLTAIEESDIEALKLIKPKNKREAEIQLAAFNSYLYDDEEL